MKYQKTPTLTGLQLIRLLKKAGWIEHRHATHGVSLIKQEKNRTRITIVPKSRATLPRETLMAILGEKQTCLGKKGLLKLLNKYN